MNPDHITLDSNEEKKQKFCAAWPSVKEGLQMLAGLVKNPIAKGAINLVITAGDTVSSTICK